MAVIGFICFVSVLGNFYQAIYDEIIYDNFGTGKEFLSNKFRSENMDRESRTDGILKNALYNANTSKIPGIRIISDISETFIYSFYTSALG